MRCVCPCNWQKLKQQQRQQQQQQQQQTVLITSISPNISSNKTLRWFASSGKCPTVSILHPGFRTGRDICTTDTWTNIYSAIKPSTKQTSPANRTKNKKCKKKHQLQEHQQNEHNSNATVLNKPVAKLNASTNQWNRKSHWPHFCWQTQIHKLPTATWAANCQHLRRQWAKQRPWISSDSQDRHALANPTLPYSNITVPWLPIKHSCVWALWSQALKDAKTTRFDEFLRAKFALSSFWKAPAKAFARARPFTIVWAPKCQNDAPCVFWCLEPVQIAPPQMHFDDASKKCRRYIFEP